MKLKLEQKQITRNVLIQISIGGWNFPINFFLAFFFEKVKCTFPNSAREEQYITCESWQKAFLININTNRH